MKNTLWIFSALLLLTLAKSAYAQQAKTIAEKADEYLMAVTRLNRFNGTVLIAQRGTILLQKGYGWRNELAKIPNDTNSIYQLGSITKTFVGAAILQLQAEGKLSVVDKLNKFLPDYPNGNQITLNDLFAHTSGIYDYKNFIYSPDGPDKVDLTRPVSKEKLVLMFSSKPTTKPGEEKYTNSGYFLLGLVIEKVTGKPFETVIRERFITPLQLSQTGFDFVNLQQPGKTTPYTFQKDSVLTIVAPIDSTAGYAAGGLFSTVGDLYRWSRALQTHRMLGSENWKLALSPIGETKWSYGWGINTFKKTNDMAYQNGNLPGFGTYLFLFPQKEIVLIALQNVDDASDLTSLEPIMRDLALITFALPYQIPKNRKSIALSETILQQYVGVYQEKPKRKMIITLDGGRLSLQITGQPKLEIYPESETDFFLKVVDAQLTVKKDTAGQVSEIVIHQYGRDFRWQKID